MSFKKINGIREPIILFFGFGILLFIVYSLLTGFFDNQNKKIYITNTQIDILKETFQKTWNRDPTQKELNAQIENLVKDEVFFREAVAMGLDKSDPSVKRRLRQLMEIMMDDAATVYPSEDQLKTFLIENPEKFLADPIISFEQLYFSEENKHDAEAQLYKLSNNIPLDQNSLGSLALIPSTFEGESKYATGRLLGKPFAEELFTLETGKWAGPIKSAYGWHLVFIHHLQPGKLPELSDVWDVVEREWGIEQKRAKKEQQYNQMKANYKVVIENEK